MTAQLAEAMRRVWAVLDTEPTVAELAPHVTKDQASTLRDLESWAHDLLAARPAIQPAKTWPTPTEHRQGVAQRIRANNERSIDRGRRRRSR